MKNIKKIMFFVLGLGLLSLVFIGANETKAQQRAINQHTNLLSPEPAYMNTGAALLASIDISGTDGFTRTEFSNISATETGAKKVIYNSWNGSDGTSGGGLPTGPTLDRIYYNYLDGSGKVVLALGMETDLFTKDNFTANYTKLKNTVIKVTYPKVGYMLIGGNKVEVGAKLTIKNMQKNPLSLKKDSKGNDLGTQNNAYPNKGVIIDLASNLYSGMVISGLSSAEYDFEFFDISDNSTINFTGQSDNQFLTFNSLNAYGETYHGDSCVNGTTGKCLSGEFARALNSTNNNAEVASPTNVQPGTRYFSDVIDQAAKNLISNAGGNTEFPNVWGATNNIFTDYLGGTTYNKASVLFDLTGPINGFEIGTAGGAVTGNYFRAWYTFSATALMPVPHDNPYKTVSPLQDSQGKDYGFDKRFYDDLDVFNYNYSDPSSGSKWGGDCVLKANYSNTPSIETYESDPNKQPDEVCGLPEEVWVPGHTPTGSNFIAENRTVGKGEEFYYFINQPTINVAEQSIAVPNQYVIKDTFAEGIKLSTGTVKDFTLYNVDGTELELTEEMFSFDGKDGFVLTLSEELSKKINEASASTTGQYFGADFSLRIKAENTLNFNNSDQQANLSNNTAVVEFIYTEENKDFSALTNAVQIRREHKNEFELLKTDLAGNPLPGVEFKFSIDNTDDHENPYIYSEVTDKDGKIFFPIDMNINSIEIIEVKQANGYFENANTAITLEYNSSTNEWQVKAGTENPMYSDIETGALGTTQSLSLKAQNERINKLVLDKVDFYTGKPLAGVEFDIKQCKLVTPGDIEDDCSNTTYTSDDKGKVEIDNLHIDDYLIIKEVKTLGRYLLDDHEIKISYDKSIDKWLMETDFEHADFSMVGVDGQPMILSLELKNIITDALNLVKKDAKTNKGLANAEFEIVVGDETFTKVSDKNGLIHLEDIDVSKVKEISVKEIKAPKGYILNKKL